MEVIVGECLPYYHEEDFLQAFLWYERVLIAELVHLDLSIGKVNMNCRGPIWGQLTKRALLQVVGNSIAKEYQEDEPLSRITKELLGEQPGTSYHCARDVGELITVIDLGIPVLEKPNPHFPKAPTVHTRLEQALGSSPLLKRESGELQRFELARDLILPRFDISSIDDILRYRDMKSVRHLREQIEDAVAACAKAGGKLEFAREFVTEINARLYKDIYGKRPGIARTALQSTALWLGELAVSALLAFPTPAGPIISIVEKLRERARDKESWAYLLLSMNKCKREHEQQP